MPNLFSLLRGNRFCQPAPLQPQCYVVSQLNDGVGVVLGHAVMGEHGVHEGTDHASLRCSVLRISVADVFLPTLTTWGRRVRKCRIQLQREVFSPMVLSDEL